MAYVLRDTAWCWALKQQPLTLPLSLSCRSLDEWDTWTGASTLATPEPFAGSCLHPSIPPSAPQVVFECLLCSVFPKPCLELGEVRREGAERGRWGLMPSEPLVPALGPRPS